MNKKREYEFTVIIDPSVGSKKKAKILEKIKDLIKKDKGKITKQEEWGVKELAYPIKKNKEALYFYFELQSAGKLDKLLQEYMDMEEKLLRYLLVKK